VSNRVSARENGGGRESTFQSPETNGDVCPCVAFSRMSGDSAMSRKRAISANSGTPPGNLRFDWNAWWAREDSNLQPSGYEPPALTIELRARSRHAAGAGAEELEHFTAK
jgi:hypothetical protein